LVVLIKEFLKADKVNETKIDTPKKEVNEKMPVFELIWTIRPL